MPVLDDLMYERRRIDELTDNRLRGIEREQRETSAKIDRLEARLNYIAGGLAVLSIIINFVAPLILQAITNGRTL